LSWSFTSESPVFSDSEACICGCMLIAEAILGRVH
jgi:hypothetical protein